MPDVQQNRPLRWPLAWGLGLLLLVPLFAVCTEAELELMEPDRVFNDDKLEISGSICTSPPDEITFPVRLLFIVDVSSSMLLVDPADPVTGETNRERAVRETWQRLLEESPEGVEVGIIRFAADSSSTVAIVDEDGIPQDYFTADPQRLLEGTAALAETAATTNFISALNEGYFQMRTELLQTSLEALPLSKYIVIFLSDGVPNLDASEARDTSPDRIRQSVQAMVELANIFRVGDFSFHTAFLNTGIETIDEEAEELLRSMARVGGGNYRSFPTGQELNFLFAELTILRRVFSLERLGAINMNMVVDTGQMPPPPVPVEDLDMGMDAGDLALADMGLPDTGFDMGVDASMEIPFEPVYFVDNTGSGYPECGDFLVDTDGDGLADIIEDEIGTDPFHRDSDGDGLSDFLEWKFRDSGLDPLDPSDSACYIAPPCVDSNQDGYCDCLRDSNLDGICDCVTDPDEECRNELGHDCIDLNFDGLCDCPDSNGDGYCDYEDSTGDGLHDCEEVFYGTSQRGVDTDGDGFPDFVELRFRTDALRPDSSDDIDLDGVPNGIEILANTNPRCDDSRIRSRTAYRYQLQQRERTGNISCYDFSIGNITLVPTRPNPYELYPGNGWNRIILYAGEVPFDDPGASGRFRFACVMASYGPDGDYKNPPSGRVQLREEDFVDVREFDPDIHCIWP